MKAIPKPPRRVWLVRGWTKYGVSPFYNSAPFASEAAAIRHVAEQRARMRTYEWDGCVLGPFVLEKRPTSPRNNFR